MANSTWVAGAAGGTPLSAARLNDLETRANLVPYAADGGNSAAAGGNVETLARFNLSQTTTTASQRVFGAYFVPVVNATVVKLGLVVGDTGGTSLTFCRLGLFTVAADFSLTLVARTANDTSLGTAAFTPYDSPLATAGGYPSSYALTAGTRYSIAFLQVGATVANLRGVGVADPALLPYASWYADTQSDIATSYAIGSFNTHYECAYYTGKTS